MPEKMTTPAPTPPFVHDMPEPAPDDDALAKPVEFDVNLTSCLRKESAPIRSLASQFSVTFDSTGWKQILLLGFEFVDTWPDATSTFADPAVMTSLKGMCSSSKTGISTFEWTSTALPQNMQDQIKNLKPGKFAIVKFSLLAEKETGGWMFADPGTGISP